MKSLVILRQLGKMRFEEALNIQTAVVNKHLRQLQNKSEDCILDTLLIVEHFPTYTIGIRTADYPAEEEVKLKELGAEFHRTNRGGLITFHGPGQLVAYPILNLANYKKSIKWYVQNLEKTLIATCASFGVLANTCQHTGVWVNDKKVAAIGIHARRFITNHGIALNSNVDLKWFQHIVPCGIPNLGVTSLSDQLQRVVTIAETLPHFQAAFEQHFQCKLVNEVDLCGV